MHSVNIAMIIVVGLLLIMFRTDAPSMSTGDVTSHVLPPQTLAQDGHHGTLLMDAPEAAADGLTPYVCKGHTRRLFLS